MYFFYEKEIVFKCPSALTCYMYIKVQNCVFLSLDDIFKNGGLTEDR